MPNSAKSRTAGFTDVDVPDQSGKTFIVTGPTAASASQYRACWRHVARECSYEGVLVAMSYSISTLIIRNLHVFGFSLFVNL